MTAVPTPTPPAFAKHRGNGARLKKALAASAVLHLVFFTVMNLQFRFKETSRLAAPIQMVELGGPSRSAKAVSAPPVAKPAPKEAAKPAPPPPPPPPKAAAKAAPPPLKAPVVAQPPPKAVTVPVEQPVKKKPPEPEYTAADTAQKMAKLREKHAAAETRESAREAGDVRGAIENIRKRVGETPAPTTKAAPAHLAADGPAGVVSGGSGMGALAAMRSTSYRNLLWAHVKDQWALPPSLSGTKLQTVIGVRIDRFGAVTKYWVETGSGSEAFDQSALRAIGRSSPFPPVPKDLPDDDFEGGIFFRFRE